MQAVVTIAEQAVPVAQPKAIRIEINMADLLSPVHP